MQSSENQGAKGNLSAIYLASKQDNTTCYFQFFALLCVILLGALIKKLVNFPKKELGTAARPQFQEVFNQLWNETTTS